MRSYLVAYIDRNFKCMTYESLYYGCIASTREVGIEKRIGTQDSLVEPISPSATPSLFALSGHL